VDGLGTMSVQWLRDGVAISGATGTTYTLGDADVGKQISAQVTYTDGQGTNETVTSAQTAAVTGVNDTPTGQPTITGTATENQVLTVNTSAIVDADGLGTMSVQWLRDGVAISGATGTTYTLGDADVGKQISVSVSYTDGQGTSETLTSAQTAAVANVNDTPTGLPTITGTATEDQVLTVSTSAIADVEGLGAMSVQWLRDGVAVSGATGTTYTLGDADVGKQISVSVNYTDGLGTSETVTSAQTSAVANLLDPAFTGVKFGSNNYANFATFGHGGTVTGGFTGTLGHDFAVGQTVRVTFGDAVVTGVINDQGTFNTQLTAQDISDSRVFYDSSFLLLVELLDGTNVTASQTVTVTVDADAPTISMPSTLTTDYGALSAGGTTRDRTVSFSGDASDNGSSGIDHILVVDNGVEIGRATLVPGGGYSFTTPELAEGAHSLLFLAVDVAGNAAFTGPFTFTVDTTPPEVTSDQSVTVRENQTVVYQATGVSVAAWSIASGGDGALFAVDATGRVTCVNGTGLDFETKSNYTFTLVAADTAGNTTEHAVSLTALDVPDLQVQSVTVGGSDNIVSLTDLNWVDSDEVVDVAVTLSGEYVSTAEDGFTIVSYRTTVITPGGAWYSSTATPTEGRVVVQVPVTELEAGTSLTVTVTAVIRDELTGSESTFDVTSAAYPHTYQIDLVDPTLAVTTFQDADNVNLLAADGVIIYRDAITLGGTVSGGGTGGTGPTLQVYDNNVLLGSPTVDSATGAWTYSASGLAEGSHTVRIVYTDWAGNATEMVRQFTYTVDSAAPSITTPTNITVDENAALSVVLAATDVSPLTWSVVSAMDEALFSIADGNRLILTTGTPDFETRMFYNVRVRATDSSGNYSDKNLTIYLNDLNDPSVITGDTTATLQEDVGVNGSGQLVATGVLSVNDPDGAGHNFFASPLTFTGNYGTFTITEAGAWTYVADNSQAAIQSLSGPGITLTDAFVVRTPDETTATVTITITGTNDAPVISSGTGTVTEDTSPTATGTLTATDADNPALAFVAGTQAGAYGSLTLNAAGAWTYTLGAAAQALAGGQVVTDTFTVTLTDGSTTTVTITATGTDEGPVISSGTGTVTEDTSPTATGTLTATDPGNPALAFVAGTQSGAYGSLTLNAAGAWTYTLGAAAQALAGGQVVTDTFTVTLTDGSTTTVTITATGTDDAPVIGSAIVTFTEGGATTASGTLTATDVDGPALSFIASEYEGDFSRVHVNADGTWTAEFVATAEDLAAGVVREEVVNVRLNDTDQEAAITIRWVGVDDAPVISTGTGTVTEDTSVTATGTLTATDADNPALAFVAGTLSGTYGSLTIDASGAWTYTLDSRANVLAGGATAADTIGVSLSDGSTSSIAIAITGTNDAPSTTTSTGSIAVVEDTQTTITLANLITLLGATDVDGSVSAVHLSGSVGSFGTLRIGTSSATATSYNASTNFTIDATNNAYFSPGPNRTGTYSLLSASLVDNSGASSSQAALSVAISPVNDAPSMTAMVTPGNSIDVGAGYASANLFASVVQVTDPDSTQITLMSFICTSGWDYTYDTLEIASDFAFDLNLFDIATSANSMTVTPKSGATPSFEDWALVAASVGITSDSGALTGVRTFSVTLSDGQATRNVDQVFAVGGGTSAITVEVVDSSPAAMESTADTAAAMAIAADGAVSAGPALPLPDSDNAMYPEIYHYWHTPDSPFLNV
jgi:VCBS repeat-containing protein